ncbi:ABC transporter substrate-binding protein [Gracilibacillus alcaliphilus]|nr:multiple sugar transport system substrate-binding protein [Gracilibacillus alcaliphilus]
MMFKFNCMRLPALLVSLFILFFVFGCSAEDSDTADNTGSSEDGVTQITYWHNWEVGPGGEEIKQSVAAFNESHPDIEVTPVYVAADGGDSVSSKLVTAVAGGNPPDVMLASRYGIAEYMDSLTLLNDLAERDGITEDIYYDWAWGESTFEGNILGLPYDGTSRALYYNKDHFEEAGLDPEDPPTTIEELEEAAHQLTKQEDGRFTQYGMIPWLGEGWLYSWGWSFGGEFVDETNQVTADNPKVVEALEWMTDFATDLGAQNVLSFANSEGSDAQDPFISEQVSMVVQGNWIMEQIEEYNPDLNYGVTYIPTPTGDNFTTFLGGRALIIPKGVEGEQLEAAWEFVKWLSSTEDGQKFKEIKGEYSVLPEVNEELYGDIPNHQPFLDVLPNGKHRPVVLAGNMMWDELAKAPDLVLDGQGTPQEILDRINETINNAIEQEEARRE